MHSLKVLDQDFDSSGAIFLPLTSQLKTKQKKKIFNSAITTSISNVILLNTGSLYLRQYRGIGFIK